MADLSFVREQALENCRVLFSQEVEITIISRINRRSSGYSPTVRDYTDYAAVVLPKACSLASMVKSGAGKVLFETQLYASYDEAIRELMRISADKIGRILQPPSSEVLHYWIDKSAIPSMCNITVPDDAQTEPESAQTTVGEDKVEDDKATEMNTLQEDTGNKGVGNSTVGKGRIWRVVGYTPSGEPCIEEHEPEASNTKSLFSSHVSTFNSTTDFTPGTSVVSDSGTITLSAYDNHSPEECTKKLEEANKEIAELQRNIEEANKEIERLEKVVFDADALCKIQQKKLEDYEVEKEQSKVATESLSNELTSLKASIRAISGVL